MIQVLLIHSGKIPHYRIPIYNYLSWYLRSYSFEIIVLSGGIQPGNPHAVEFQYKEIKLSVVNITRILLGNKIDVIILFVDMRHLYLFPTYMIAKGLLFKKMVWWGQGRDLNDREARIKNLAYATEHALCDSIILYAEHLKKYIHNAFHRKVFIANNTLCINYSKFNKINRKQVLSEFGITTSKNIICVGRLQRRKRLEHLMAAHEILRKPDIGLILVGPDTEGVLEGQQRDNLFKIGPLYGDRLFDLLSASDVYCLPGAVGLSIVDAFHCGLPFVTEDGDESAEIMYLKDGVNGFVVPRGDIPELARKLSLLLEDDNLRSQFSIAAKNEITENGNVEKLCVGFRDALFYATNQKEKIGKDCSNYRSSDIASPSN